LDITTVTEYYLCNSCGACYTVCPVNAISFDETVGGYLFPKIDDNLCTGCGLCYKVCPGIHKVKSISNREYKDPFRGNILNAFISQATDKETYLNGQSGGVTTAILHYLFRNRLIQKALLAEMTQNETLRGSYYIANNESEIFRSQKSKYTPITLLAGLEELEGFHGGVAIVGLPCHIHGFKNLLDQNPARFKHIKFFLIGLICDRIMTSVAIDYMSSPCDKQSIKQFVFRDTTRTGYPGKPVIVNQDDTFITLPIHGRTSIKDILTPLRCRLCFDKFNVYSDIVLGDPHGISGVNRETGESLILVRNQEMIPLLRNMEHDAFISTRETSIEEALKGQGLEKKKKIWAMNIVSWIKKGREVPQFNFEIGPYIKSSGENKYITESLKMDNMKSRKALLVYIKKRMKRKEAWKKTILYRVFRKISRIL
jgi:coenzyme F420 hydrogenase subunit beta